MLKCILFVFLNTILCFSIARADCVDFSGTYDNYKTSSSGEWLRSFEISQSGCEVISITTQVKEGFNDNSPFTFSNKFYFDGTLRPATDPLIGNPYFSEASINSRKVIIELTVFEKNDSSLEVETKAFITFSKNSDGLLVVEHTEVVNHHTNIPYMYYSSKYIRH